MLNVVALEQQVAEVLRTHQIPGLSLAAVHQGEIVYAKGFGVTNAEEGGGPVTPETLFRIGSTTKPLTGTAIMRLVEMGKLDLDQPVSAYLPWFQFSVPGAADQITLRMLLSHTSGLSSVANAFGPRDPEGLDRTVREVVSGLPFLAPPGKIFSYCNPGIALAAYIASVVYGKPYGEMMRELVFQPLQMERTTFDPTVAMTYPLGLPHDLDREGKLRVIRPFADHSGYHPAGFAISTVLDLARFAILHLNQGRYQDRQLLTPESVREMHTEQVSQYTVDQRGYGITLYRQSHRGMQLVEHGGGIQNYHASFDMLPEAGAAVIILASRIAPPGVHRKLIDTIFEQIAGLPTAPPQPQEIIPDRSRWPRYTGTYVNRFWGLATIAESEGQLTVSYRGETLPLTACQEDVYFVQDQDGNLRHSVGFPPDLHYLMVDGNDLTRFEPDPSFAVDPETLKAYEGAYITPVTGRETARLAVREGQLWATFEWHPDEPVLCTPLNSHTRFASGQGLFTMETKPDGTLVLVMNGWRSAKG